MEILLAPIRPFVGHPGLVATVAIILFGAFWALKAAGQFVAWPILLPAAAWGLYVPWEIYCSAGRYNIRADLLLIWPVLAVVTIIGVGWSLMRRRVKDPGTRAEPDASGDG